jgi:hypothetical protein
MDTANIIEELENQLSNINRAITALRGNDGHGKRGLSKANASTHGGPTNGRRRHLSAAARKRIGEAMKKRWAERKKKTT